MVTIPSPITDAFQKANATIAGTSQPNLPGFNSRLIPSQSGTGVTQSRIPDERAGYPIRNMVRWFIPELGIVEMYINPQSISYQYKKHITNQRTKGGYILQYWGLDLGTLNIQGTTGSSGVEGINVLNDVYLAEQNAFDPYALALAAEQDAAAQDQLSFLGDFPSNNAFARSGQQSTQRIMAASSNAIKSGSANTTRQAPTLASLAFSVEMYYSGWVFRGYFTDFRVDERAEKLGLFDYSMTFMVTQRRGIRENFFSWHRSSVSGPSNTDPDFGTPYSYVHFGTNSPVVVPPQTDEGGISLLDALHTGASLINKAGSGISSLF